MRRRRMPKFLKHKEFLPFAPDSGSVRVNHNTPECAGDSSSMNIEVKEDGSIFAYCHRCSKSGSYNSPYYKGKSLAENHRSHRKPSVGRGQRAAGYERATRHMGDWTAEARKFILKTGLSQLEVTANDIRYDEEIDGVYLTVLNATGSVGYILRRFNYDGPKYLNDFDDVYPRCHVSRPPVDGKSVVLVEDILSCIKVGRQFNAVSLLGTNTDPLTMNWLMQNYDRFYIFLDDDNKIVKQHQRVLKNTFEWAGKATIITGIGKDPKYLSNAELREIIK
jgi:hypothetical protein